MLHYTTQILVTRPAILNFNIIIGVFRALPLSTSPNNSLSLYLFEKLKVDSYQILSSIYIKQSDTAPTSHFRAGHCQYVGKKYIKLVPLSKIELN